MVLGGVGSDDIVTGNGNDVVTGDNGTVVNDANGILQQVYTGDPQLGGNDTISTGDGNDVAMGGAGSDTVLSDGGFDILFGDGGSVTYGPGTQIYILSLDPQFGGDDVIDGGAGTDIVVGGQGNDLMYGSLDEDLLFGSNVAVTLVDGLVRRIEVDTHDLVTESLFKSFDALDDDEAVAIYYEFQFDGVDDDDAAPAVLQLPHPLLNVTGFEALFDLAVDFFGDALYDVSAFRVVFDSGVVTVIRAAIRDAAIEGTEVPGVPDANPEPPAAAAAGDGESSGNSIAHGASPGGALAGDDGAVDVVAAATEVESPVGEWLAGRPGAAMRPRHCPCDRRPRITLHIVGKVGRAYRG